MQVRIPNHARVPRVPRLLPASFQEKPKLAPGLQKLCSGRGFHPWQLAERHQGGPFSGLWRWFASAVLDRNAQGRLVIHHEINGLNRLHNRSVVMKANGYFLSDRTR
eukprot:1127985-Pyramimonas_sp.AAC.1